jgi:hypothetical protein
MNGRFLQPFDFTLPEFDSLTSGKNSTREYTMSPILRTGINLALWPMNVLP